VEDQEESDEPEEPVRQANSVNTEHQLEQKDLEKESLDLAAQIKKTRNRRLRRALLKKQ